MSALPLPSRRPREAAPPGAQALESHWLEVSSMAFAWRVGLWAGMVVAGAWLTMPGDPWVRLLGLVLLGAGMAHGVELSHQALHHTGFQSRRLNEVLGVAMGLPMLVSFYEYRINHLKHHALLGTP